MKLNKYSYLLGAALAVTMAACTESEPKYTPAAPFDAPDYYFSLSTTTSYEVGDNDSQIAITVYRTDDTAAATLAVASTVSPADAPFQIPAEVTFAEGAKTADVAVTFDPEDLDMSVDYQISLNIGSFSNDYLTQELTLDVKYITWMPVIGKNAAGEEVDYALYRDDTMTTFFTSVEAVEYPVKMEYNPATPGIYRVVSPYGEAYPYNEPGDYTEEPTYMYFNCTNPKQVFICDSKGNAAVGGKMVAFFTGMNWGYGEVVITGLANNAIAGDGDPTPYYGTLADGIITFPEKALLIAMLDYNDGGLYYANTSGMFRVMFPGVEAAPDPSLMWDEIGEAQFTDGIIYPLYFEEAETEGCPTYNIRVTRNQADPNLYRIYDLWKYSEDGGCPYGVNYDGEIYTVLDVNNPECPVIDLSETGIVDEEAGPLYFMSYAALLMGNGNSVDQVIDKGANGSFADGVATFPAGTMLWGAPNDQGSISLAKCGYESVIALPNAVQAPAKAKSIVTNGASIVNGHMKASTGDLYYTPAARTMSSKLIKR